MKQRERVHLVCQRCGTPFSVEPHRPENLEVVFQPDHVREHIREMLAARKIKAGY